MPRVFHSVHLKPEAEAVWQALRDFGGLHRWLPGIAMCELEGGLRGDQVGAIRRIVARDGQQFREQLVTLSDYEMVIGYSIVDSPLPISAHFAELRVIPITEGGGSFVGWSAEFLAPEAEVAGICQWMTNDVFRPGLSGLAQMVAS
jgi:hypothetical protein